MVRIKNKAARITVRALLYGSGVILFLFVLLSVYIEINKKEILADLKEGLARKIQGNIVYSSADVTVWRSFPYIGLRLSGVNLSDSLDVSLVKMEEISVKASVFDFLGNSTELKNLSFRNGTIHLFTDSSGYTNKYLVDRNTAANQRKNKIEISSASLKNVRVILENKIKNKRFDIVFRKLDADISTKDKVAKIRLVQSSMVKGLGFNLSKGSYLKDQSLQGTIRLSYDQNTSHLTFNETRLKIDGQPYYLKGDFRMDAPGSFSLSIKTRNAPFNKLKRIFAQRTMSKLKDLDIKQPIDVEAMVEGSLGYRTIPRVTASWMVKQNKLVTPVAAFDDCSFNGTFSNEVVKGKLRTDENSSIVLTGFKGNWEGIQLAGEKISITDLVNPYVDMSLRSAADLKDLNEKLGLRTIRFLGGVASLNFHYTGPLQKDISLDKMNGRLKFSGATIQYIPRDFTFNNCSGDILFSSDKLQADNLKFDMGSNHFSVNLAGSNLSALSSENAGRAMIDCNVSIPSLNIAELKSLFAAKKTVQAVKSPSKILFAANKIDDALDHGDLRMSITAGSVRYNAFMGKDLRGTVLFSNNDLLISGVSVAHAEGTLLLDADIKQNKGFHTASAKVKLNNVDVARVFKAFDDFGQDGISHENLRGRLNANISITMSINNAGSIIPGTMNGVVDFSLKNGLLTNYEPMQNIKGFVFKNKDMNNVSFAELKNRLEISNYKIRIPRMEIQSTAIAMFVEGVYDIKKTESKIDIQVPLKGLKKKDSSYIPQNIGVDARAGMSIYLTGKNDKTGKVKLGLNTSKTIRKIF